MPSLTGKDERQYKHVKETALDDGKSAKKAQEIAARTVIWQRRLQGRTPNRTTQRTGNPHRSLDEKSVQELRNRAAELKIAGRTKMRKNELIDAIRDR